MPTTTRKEDYLGRDLSNATPGTTQATDFLGRAIGASNTDFNGRALSSAPWAVSTAYTVGSIVYVAGGELVCTVAGTSHASVTPTAPGSVGGTVTDNTVTWQRTE
jgi:hypothetical protein